MNGWRGLAVAVALALVVVATFSQVRGFGYTDDWDDNSNVRYNPHLNPVTRESLARIWQEPYQQLYVPVTYTAYAAVAHFFGTAPEAAGGKRFELQPQAFHLVNLLLHGLNVALLFLLLRRLVGDAWGAAAGALLFGLHPLATESVAWISELKGVLSASWSLVTLHLFLNATQESSSPAPRRPLWLCLSTATFLLALLAKPTAVILPVLAFVVCAYLREPRRRLSQAALITLGAWLCGSVALTVATGRSQSLADLDIPFPVPALWQRPFLAGDAVAFYLWKLVAPIGLAPDYGRTPQHVLLPLIGYLTWLCPALLFAVLWVARRRWPRGILALVVFVLALAPVLGFIPFAFQRLSTVADRFAYFALIGPAIALADLVAKVKVARKPIVALVGLALWGLAVLSYRQTSFWTNLETLARRELVVNSASCAFRDNLAGLLYQRGERNEALQLEEGAIQGNPGCSKSWANYALLLYDMGNYPAAVEACNEAIKVRPAYAPVYNTLGMVFVAMGKIPEAVAAWSKALEFNPTYPQARQNLTRFAPDKLPQNPLTRDYRQMPFMAFPGWKQSNEQHS